MMTLKEVIKANWDATNLTATIDENFMGGQLLAEAAVGWRI